MDGRIRSEKVNTRIGVALKLEGILQFTRTVIWSDVIFPLFSVCSADTMYAADILVGYSVGRNSRNTECILSQLMIQVRTDLYWNYLQFLECLAAWIFFSLCRLILRDKKNISCNRSYAFQQAKQVDVLFQGNKQD